MKLFTRLSMLAVLALPSLAADTVITKAKHTDASTIGNRTQPAQDSTETTWVGKDRMRVEDGAHVTIIRADLKKLFLLDTQEKTVTTIDLPIDMSKLMPAEMLEMMKPMLGQMKTTVTPTTETKKIKEWQATRYTLTMTMPMGGSMTQEIWATKDVKLDVSALRDMSASLLAMNPMQGGMVEEMKKIDGVPVLVERTQSMMNMQIKSREEVVSIEQKEPAEGLYDAPKDFTEKPFDPMGAMRGGAGAPPIGGKPMGGGKPGGPPSGGKDEKHD